MHKDLEVRKAYHRTYYKRNNESISARRRRRRAERKGFVETLKITGCRRCGYDECLAALEFHHKDPATKVMSIAEAVRAMWPVWRIAEEVQKCELLCANCHRHKEVTATLLELEKVP